MEETTYHISQKDGHLYLFDRYRDVKFKPFFIMSKRRGEDDTFITVVSLFVQYKENEKYRRVELILKTIEDTNVPIIKDRLVILNAEISS